VHTSVRIVENTVRNPSPHPAGSLFVAFFDAACTSAPKRPAVLPKSFFCFYPLALVGVPSRLHAWANFVVSFAGSVAPVDEQRHPGTSRIG
jgi:hypothetical protein